MSHRRQKTTLGFLSWTLVLCLTACANYGGQGSQGGIHFVKGTGGGPIAKSGKPLGPSANDSVLQHARVVLRAIDLDRELVSFAIHPATLKFAESAWMDAKGHPCLRDTQITAVQTNVYFANCPIFLPGQAQKNNQAVISGEQKICMTESCIGQLPSNNLKLSGANLTINGQLNVLIQHPGQQTVAATQVALNQVLIAKNDAKSSDSSASVLVTSELDGSSSLTRAMGPIFQQPARRPVARFQARPPVSRIGSLKTNTPPAPTATPWTLIMPVYQMNLTYDAASGDIASTSANFASGQAVWPIRLILNSSNTSSSNQTQELDFTATTPVQFAKPLAATKSQLFSGEAESGAFKVDGQGNNTVVVQITTSGLQTPGQKPLPWQ